MVVKMGSSKSIDLVYELTALVGWLECCFMFLFKDAMYFEILSILFYDESSWAW